MPTPHILRTFFALLAIVLPGSAFGQAVSPTPPSSVVGVEVAEALEQIAVALDRLASGVENPKPDGWQATSSATSDAGTKTAAALLEVASSVDDVGQAIKPTPLNWWDNVKALATAFSIFVTSAAAVGITWWHNKKQEEHDRKKAHGELRLKAIDVHDKFWNSDMSGARCLITCEPEYSEIEGMLATRASSPFCTLDAKAYEKLESIDEFYSAVMSLRRIEKSLDKYGEDKDSAEMIRKSYDYWVAILKRPAGVPGNRDALRAYLTKFWPDVVPEV